MNSVLVAALYKFVDLPDFTGLQAPLLACCESQGVKGTLLLAREGINGTIAGPPAGVKAVLDYLRSDPRLATLEHKESTAKKMPFYRMKVRLKREIVTLGVPSLDPNKTVGEYVKPEAWNALIDDPNVVVIDTRNDYEVAIGTFKRAINPNIKTFRDLPQWLAKQPELAAKPKVAMFCTGGIRCEKSTAYLKSQGFDEVYHLQGGILKYLEVMPEECSRWEGECFVFDERVSVGHGLKVGEHEFCRSCRHPISATDKASPQFELGVSCPHCHHTLTDERRHNLRQRQLQVELAAKRGEEHIGVKFEPKRKSL